MSLGIISDDRSYFGDFSVKDNWLIIEYLSDKN